MRNNQLVQKSVAMATVKGIHHISLNTDNAEVFRKALDFYCNVLKLEVRREWNRGVMIDTGNGLIEIFNNQKGESSKGSIAHFALLCDDAEKLTEDIRKAGYKVISEVRDVIIRSQPPYPIRMTFVVGPLNEEIEIFEER